MKKLLFILVAALALSCSSSKHARNTTAPAASSASASAASSGTQDGSSFEKAIYITEKGETAGVGAEYKWIRENYPGSHVNGQALSNKNGKPYDILHITTADGTKKDVYFDISGFFGKY